MVLGVNWDAYQDELLFSEDDVVNNTLAYDGVVTKHLILKTVSSIFDLLGVLALVY